MFLNCEKIFFWPNLLSFILVEFTLSYFVYIVNVVRYPNHFQIEHDGH